MKRSTLPLLFTGFALALGLVWGPVAVTVHAARLTGFVDYDGDGIDDNRPDDDGDGIPDEFEFHGFVAAPVAELQIATMFTTAPAADQTETPVSKSDNFGGREFTTRAICETRSDFDAGFGSGLGLGGGLGGGGACAGGVCF